MAQREARTPDLADLASEASSSVSSCFSNATHCSNVFPLAPRPLNLRPVAVATRLEGCTFKREQSFSNGTSESEPQGWYEQSLALFGDQGSKDGLVLDISKRSDFNIVQRNGQRSYGGPPPTWIGPPPPKGCEIFVGKVPRDILEDELVPLFERAGRIYELRLMITFSGTNRGFFFVSYSSREEALKAVKMMNNYEIRPGKRIGVMMSADNRGLILSGLPLGVTVERIRSDLEKILDTFSCVQLYTERGGYQKYCRIEFDNHRDAALAKKRLVPEGVMIAGCGFKVDWAGGDIHAGNRSKKLSKSLLVRNLPHHLAREGIWNLFNELSDGQVLNVDKFLRFAFVHFFTRSGAEMAFEKGNEFKAQGIIHFDILWSKNDESDGNRRLNGYTNVCDNNVRHQPCDPKLQSQQRCLRNYFHGGFPQEFCSIKNPTNVDTFNATYHDSNISLPTGYLHLPFNFPQDSLHNKSVFDGYSVPWESTPLSQGIASIIKSNYI